MAVDTLFDKVRLLVQGGTGGNRATASPWATTAQNVTYGPDYLVIGGSNSLLVGSPSADAGIAVYTCEVVFRPKTYTGVANLYRGVVELVLIQAGVVGVFANVSLFGGFEKVWEFPIPQTGDVALAVTTVASSMPKTIQVTARVVQSSGSPVTHTSPVISVLPDLTRNAYFVSGPDLIVASPDVSINRVVTQVGFPPNASRNGVTSFSLENATMFTPAGSMTITATKGATTHTYTRTNLTTLWAYDIIADLVVGINGFIGGTYTSFLSGNGWVPRLTYAPLYAGDPGWTFTFNANCPVVTQSIQTPIYSTPSGQDQITQFTITPITGAPKIGLGGAYSDGNTFDVTTSGMAALVAHVNGNSLFRWTASVSQPFPTQFILTAVVSKDSWSPGVYSRYSGTAIAFDRLYLARVTEADRYATETFAWPGFAFPVTSIPGGEVADANTMLLMHLNESSGTELADVTGRTFTASADLASHTTASGKFSGALAPTSTGFRAVGGSPVPFPFPTKELTIEFFITRLSAGVNAYEVVFAQINSSDPWNGPEPTHGLMVSISSDSPRVQMDGWHTDNAFALLNLSVGQWKHLAFVRTSNSNTKWYVDGVGKNGYNMPFALSGDSGLPYIGNTSSGAYGLQHFGIDELRISNIARYTADFTPPTAPFGGDNGGVDVSLAGYNDLDTITGAGTFNLQLTAPEAYFFSVAALAGMSATGDAFSVNENTKNFAGTHTADSSTCAGSFVQGTPQNFSSDVALDGDSVSSTFYADVPIEMIGNSTLGDDTNFGISTLLSPAAFSGTSDVDDIYNIESVTDVIEPIYFAVDATVPTATLSARTTQFYVKATVPAAELYAGVSEYGGFSLEASVPKASLSAWTGLKLNSSVPRATISAVGIVPNTLRLSSELPRVVSQANLLAGRSVAVNSTAPSATLSAWTGLQLAASVPIASSAGNVVVGGAFSVSPGLVPMATLAAGASSMNVLRLNGAVPAASRAGWVAVNRNVPSARMLGSITPVVAVTRVAYSFTLANSAMTRYPAYPFIQMIRMGNSYYGIGDDGLYELGGTTDNGVSIPWSWETCMADFGQAEKKTVVSAYLGGYVPQNMTYTIKAGDVPTGTNAHTTTATAVLRNHRQKFGIGRKSRFFAFGLSATQGRVAIESIEFEMAKMSRRV